MKIFERLFCCFRKKSETTAYSRLFDEIEDELKQEVFLRAERDKHFGSAALRLEKANELSRVLSESNLPLEVVSICKDYATPNTRLEKARIEAALVDAGHVFKQF